MMKILCSYLKKHRKLILCLLLDAVLFYTVCYLYSVPSDALSYAFLLSGVVLLVFAAADFVSYAGKCRALEKMAQNITFEIPEFPETSEIAEQEYIRALSTLYERKEELESKMTIDRQEMTDYYTLWGHQIKVPIAAMQILLQSGETDAGVLNAELFKIEQYVEMVLSYLRMESISADMVLQWYPIDEIIRSAVRKYSRLFILQKIKLNYEEIGQKVLTDKKWLGFVIEQILSNALKYTPSGEISIYMDVEREQVLVIEDTGIGIREEDIPRVFEKGFTGYNGRSDKKSTGIGLYLCRRVMEKLNHRITISSELSAGTKVFLDLYRKERQSE